MFTVNWCWKRAVRLFPCCRISWFLKQTVCAGVVAQSVACWGNVFPSTHRPAEHFGLTIPVGRARALQTLYFASLSFLVFPHSLPVSVPLNIHSVCLTLISLSPFTLTCFKMCLIVTSPKNKAPQRPRLHKMLCFAISKCFWLLKSAATYQLWGICL